MNREYTQTGLLLPDPRLLKYYSDVIQYIYAQELRSASLFLMLLDPADTASVRRCEVIAQQLAYRFSAKVERTPVSDLTSLDGIRQSLFLLRFVIRNVSPDDAKNGIESVLNSLDKTAGSGGRVHTIRTGLFLPRTGTVTCRSFAHGHGHYYRYRLATFKLECVPQPLADFLTEVSTRCPDDYFRSGPRASALDLPVTVNIQKSSEHEMVRLAQRGLQVRKLKSAHEDLEKYLLNSDPKTLECEVPIWLEPSELCQLIRGELHNIGTLTGHIDVLRCDPDGKVGIWDYKPSADGETKAHVQVFLYALMLSKRTGLSLEDFRCGYFDSTNAFLFVPAEALWTPLG